MVLRAAAAWALCPVFSAALAIGASAATSDEQAVADGRTALQRAQRFPWYDRANDSLRPIELPELKERQPAGRPVDANWLRPIVWALLIVAAVGLLLAAAVGLSKRRWATSAPVKNARRGRIEQLGFLEDDDSGDYFDRCLRERRAGRFERAIIYLYAHLLTELHQRQLVRLARGKTNRQYLREIGDPALRSAVEIIVVAFEDAYFGHHRIEADRFQVCWHYWKQIEATLQPEPAAVQ